MDDCWRRFVSIRGVPWVGIAHRGLQNVPNSSTSRNKGFGRARARMQPGRKKSKDPGRSTVDDL